MQRDSKANTFMIATVLCVVCSVLVSVAAVTLRPLQEANRKREMDKNVLQAAGLDTDKIDIDEAMTKITKKLVDLETGEYVSEDEINIETYDPRSAAKDPQMSIAVPAAQDYASIKRRENYAPVYLMKADDGSQIIILPIRGLGLWSTLRGFIALNSDTTTIRGITYYEHKETPGLGGEVDNPKWKKMWVNKRAFDDQWNVRIEVIKGVVLPNKPGQEYQVDGLAGATITSRGVSDMLKYWLGENGFGPYLKRLRESGELDG